MYSSIGMQQRARAVLKLILTELNGSEPDLKTTLRIREPCV